MGAAIGSQRPERDLGTFTEVEAHGRGDPDNIHWSKLPVVKIPKVVSRVEFLIPFSDPMTVHGAPFSPDVDTDRFLADVQARLVLAVPLPRAPRLSPHENR